MARTEVTPTDLTPNAELAEPAGTTIDAALVTAGVTVIGGAPLEETFVRITQTAVAAKNITFSAGDSPPADAAGVGDLVVAMAQNDVSLVGPFSSARFIQAGVDGGELFIDFETGTTGTLWVYRVPRTA